MSGLELLFVDGGTTVAGVTAAALGALGFRQHRRDDRELADAGELGELQARLQRAHAALAASHGELTEAWGTPLSLFSARDAAAALERGVPDWAVACARKGHGLVERAAELGDLADVYGAQLDIAAREASGGRGLLRAPPLALAQHLGDAAQRLDAHVPFVALARAAFDAPAQAAPDAAPEAGGAEAAGSPGMSLQPGGDGSEALPIAILRDRGRLGELWRLQGDKMAKLFALRSGGGAGSGDLLPPDVHQKLVEVQSGDQYTAMAAAWALGRMGDPAAAEQVDGGLELREAVREAAARALCVVLRSGHPGTDECVWKAALQSLRRISHPSAAPALRELLRSSQASAACRDLAAELLGDLCSTPTGAELREAVSSGSGPAALRPLLTAAEEQCAVGGTDRRASCNGDSAGPRMQGCPVP